MSRIGKKPISIPDGVVVTTNGGVVTVKGPKGTLEKTLPPNVVSEQKEKEVFVALAGDVRAHLEMGSLTERDARALWGLARSLIANMVRGVSVGFEDKLQFEGVGYRANVEGDSLVMQLGFSHPVRFKAPNGISLSVEKNTITVTGIDKELVGKTSAEIRMLKPPEPYKGKGVRYKDEVVRRKAGKKAVASGG